MNLTCSDSLVVEGCPAHVDQIEYIASEFRIDRVFYIRGNTAAITGWQEAYVNSKQGSDSTAVVRSFQERLQRLEPIVSHFSLLGKLERLEVSETPKAAKLAKMIEQVTMPQFALFLGLSRNTCSKQADLLASAYGAGVPLSEGTMIELAEKKLNRQLDPKKADQTLAFLRAYSDGSSAPMLVLDNYPSTQEDASAFLDLFGEPSVVVNFEVSDDMLIQEEQERIGEGDFDADEFSAQLEKDKVVQAAMLDVFKERAAASFKSIAFDGVLQTAEEVSIDIKRSLLPRVFVIVAPSGLTDFSKHIANAICTFKSDGQKVPKFTVVDSAQICKPGTHGGALEETLAKALFTAQGPDNLPASLWSELFQEAFVRSPNPMGTFLVTNFPTPCAVRSSPPIRDQFSILQSICTVVGVMHVRLSDGAFAEAISEDPADLASYSDFSNKVVQDIQVQFGPGEIFECPIVESAANPVEEAKKLAAEFMAFKERRERPGA
jgi:hypothetical protein